MTEQLENLLQELETFGRQNDAVEHDRPRRMLNITRDTGEFLGVLVQACDARRVLELGTSNGYSTLWLAEALQNLNGRVTTVEMAEYKIALAAENFARSGLAGVIEQVHGEAGDFMKSRPDGAFDLVFLDSQRSEYLAWWPELQRILRAGGLIVADNALSHAPEMVPFMTRVSGDDTFTTCTLPVGNGQFLAVKRSA